MISINIELIINEKTNGVISQNYIIKNLEKQENEVYEAIESVTKYLDHCKQFITNGDIVTRQLKDLYKKYNTYCRNNNYNAIGLKKFSSELKKTCTKNRNRYGVYVVIKK